MATVRGRAAVKAAVGIAANSGDRGWAAVKAAVGIAANSGDRGRAAVKAAVGIAADRALTSWVWRWRQ